jgi:hypothetical protein
VQITLPTQPQSQAHVQQKTANAAQTQQQTINAQQQVLIEALPPVLVLHIKRFCYDKESGGVVKVGKRVRFSGELDIGSGGFLFLFCSFSSGVFSLSFCFLFRSVLLVLEEKVND